MKKYTISVEFDQQGYTTCGSIFKLWQILRKKAPYDIRVRYFA